MNRIEYLDSLRGFAMLLVVIGHVFLFGFHNSDNLFFKILCEGLEIPLFFLISGFFNAKIKSYFKDIPDKFIKLIIPAIIWLGLYCFYTDYSFIMSIDDTWKNGYWFTISLFEFIFLYRLISWTLNKCNFNIYYQNIIQICIGVVMLFVGVYAQRMGNSVSIFNILNVHHCDQYIYFILGTILSQMHKSKLNYRFKGIYKMGGAIILFIVLNIYTYKGSIRYFGPSLTIYFCVLIIIGLAVVYSFFKHYPILSNESVIGRFLKLVGKRTLDVYFIHYFFLPRHLESVGNFFETNPSPLIEYVLALLISIIVIYASLAVSAMVRMSPFTSKYMLGAK